MSIVEKLIILLLIVSNIFLFAGPGSLMGAGFLRILCRLFLLSGVAGLLICVASHASWIWWATSSVCLLMSMGAFLMYQDRTRIDTFKQKKETLVSKKDIRQPFSVEENRWEDEGGSYF